ncbi:D-aminoacyl-tRNA deacylase [Culicoides brevitarsis]|uniref:D-aminoacyl-tRNA deacylase n=1 Tax=Culicoides brevitarsis TaxID=469753 RepID=UPI00307C73A2
MKAVIQRVSSAGVSVSGELVSSIGKGLCVLVGICQSDTEKDMEYIARKILSIRLFDHNDKRWQKSVVDEKLEILCISQFTLYHRLKGNKPDFHLAMKGEEAKVLYDKLLTKLGESYEPSKIKDGVFGAMMEVNIVNSGPVTIEIESPRETTTTES